MTSELTERLLKDDSFEDEVFEAVDLHEQALSGKELTRCTFRNAKLQLTSWTRTRLEDCVFEGCDLTRALPSELALRSVKFIGCKLMGIDWSRVSPYPDVSFEACNLRYSSFVATTLRKTRFVKCELHECNFLQVELGAAWFEDCELVDTRFDGCDLRGATFLRCHELAIDPSKNRVQGTIIPTETAVRLATSFGMKVRD